MSALMWEWSGPVEETLRPRQRKTQYGADCERGIPLPPMSPLWRDHGKVQGGGGGIHIVVCSCNEDGEELKVLLSTFRTDSPASCPVRVSFIVDSSRSPVYANSDTTTVEILKRALRVTPAEEGESIGQFGCVEYSGSLDKTQVPFDLYIKGPSLPSGKRNSLVTFFDDILPVKISRGEAVEPDAVYVLDADSGHPANGLQDLDYMWRLLMFEEETACVTCPVRPIDPSQSFLALSQSFEYALVRDNIGESHFALQTTTRHVQCMFKYRSLVEDGRLAQPPVGEGAMPPLLDSFSKTAAGIPALILLDTCPSEGFLVLLRQRGFDVRACGVADGVTCVPNSWLEFYAQRRRWYAGSLVAVFSHLTGKESYFQTERRRWIISSYAFVANLYLHCGLAFLPVLLAKGIDRLNDYIDSRGTTDDGQPVQVQDQTDSVDISEHLDWIIFGVVWAFLALNVAMYLRRSLEELWMWINITSVLWMTLCLTVLVASGVAVLPWIPVGILAVPLVVVAVNSSQGAVGSWCHLVVAAVPFVLVSSVHSVLVFLYAMATLDSTEWGTRDVGSFDSGVCELRVTTMRRRKLCILLMVMAISCGLGVLLMFCNSFTFFLVVVGVPAIAYTLKILLVIIPAKMERSRQKAVLGGAGNRPLSIRRGISEMAPIHGRAPVYRTERHGNSTRNIAQARKGLAGKGATGNTSHATAEDGTPSPVDPLQSTSRSFFSGTEVAVEGESMSGPSVDRPGHRRNGSKSASMSSGFAGVAGIGGGGIGGGSMNSTEPRQMSASEKAGALAESRTASTTSRSRSRSRSPSATLATPTKEGVNSLGEKARTVDDPGEKQITPSRRGRDRTELSRFLGSKESEDEAVAGSTGAKSATPGRATKAEIRKAWGLRQPTLESDDSERSDQIGKEASSNKLNASTDRSGVGVSGARRGWGFSPSLQQEATTKSGPAAPADEGVKRYSWARKRQSTSEYDTQTDVPGDNVIGTLERRRDGIRAYESQGSMGDEDLAARNAILNSRIGATALYGYGGVRLSNSRGQPRSGKSLVGIRAAWGVSMSGSQDDLACPSPATINAVRNSRVGAVYSRGIIEENEGTESEVEDAGLQVPGYQRRPAARTLVGIRAAWGTSMGGSQDDMAQPSASDINAVMHSRAGPTSVLQDVINEDGSESETEIVETSSVVPNTSDNSHRRPSGDGTLAGVRAAWGESMGSSQEFDVPTSPSNANPDLNSSGMDGRPVGSSCALSAHKGVDDGRQVSTRATDNSGVVPYQRPTATSTPTRRPGSERRASAGVKDGINGGRKTSVGSVGGQGIDGLSSRAASGRGGRSNVDGRGHTGRRPAPTGRAETSGARGEAERGRAPSRRRSRGETAGTDTRRSALVDSTTKSRRNWTPGQSSVFDSSGSSDSDDQGNSRGLRGVQVLDPQDPQTVGHMR